MAKSDEVVASAEDRFEMTRLAAAGIDKAEVSRVELDRPGPSYMADTLKQLSQPGRQLVLILGADAAAGLDTWKDSNQIRHLTELAVVARADKLCDADIGINMEPMNISSTQVREAFRRGEDISALVPDEVRYYLDRHVLY